MESSAEARSADRSGWFEPLRSALADGDDKQRMQLLGRLFAELADMGLDGKSPRSQDSTQQLESINKKLKTVSEERAGLQDALEESRAEVAHRDRQIAAEQARNKELQALIDTSRERFDTTRKERDAFESELEERRKQVHEAEVRADDLQLKLERAQRNLQDTSRIEQRDEANQKLTDEITRLKAELETLRSDKDAQIEALRTAAAAESASGGDGNQSPLLTEMWERLARKKPPLVEGHVVPNEKSAERIADGFHELARFASSMEQDLSAVLDEWTKYDDVIKRLWRAYKASENLDKLVPATIAPTGSKPISVMMIRLHALKTWSIAVMSAFDIALKSVGPALDEHLRGDEGLGADQQIKLRDYLRNSGPDLFGQHMRTLTSGKLAEMYGHWSSVK